MSFELFLLKYFSCFVPFFLSPLQHIFLLRTYFSNSLYFFHLGFYFYSFRTLSSFRATLPFSFISTSPFSLFQLLSHTSTSHSYFPLCSFFLPSHPSLFLLFFPLSSPPSHSLSCFPSIFAQSSFFVRWNTVTMVEPRVRVSRDLKRGQELVDSRPHVVDYRSFDATLWWACLGTGKANHRNYGFPWITDTIDCSDICPW